MLQDQNKKINSTNNIQNKILQETLNQNFKSPSLFLDHYSSLKRKYTPDDEIMNHDKSREGRIMLLRQLQETLSRNEDYQKEFSNRPAINSREDSRKEAEKYHNFYSQFQIHSLNIKNQVSTVSKSISKREKELIDIKTRYDNLKRMTYQIEMHSEIEKIKSQNDFSSHTKKSNNISNPK